MKEILEVVRKNFGNPNFAVCNNSLVDWDGYDELEKKSAVHFFSKKDWKRILYHLHEGNAYYLEEWSVLNNVNLDYYARAYFEHWIDNLNSDNPDEEYIYFLIGELYQIIYMHKGSPFSSTQTEVIKRLVQLSILQAENKQRFEYYSNDIIENGRQFFSELSKHHP